MRVKAKDRLATYSTEELLEELQTAPPKQKHRPLAFLLASPDLAPIRDRLLMCGTSYEANLGRYGTERRRYRCKLQECGNCQMRASKRAMNRALSLFEVGTEFNPDRKHVTFLTIDEVGHDLERFKQKIAKVLRGTKGTGVYQVGMTGMLHWHGLVQHPNMCRRDLVLKAVALFPQERAVVDKELEDRWMGDAVAKITNYLCKPVKNRDLLRLGKKVTQKTIENWVRIQQIVTGKRTHEWGFSREERLLAREWGNKRSGDLRSLGKRNTGFTGLVDSTQPVVSGTTGDLVTQNVQTSASTSGVNGDSNGAVTDEEQKRGYTSHITRI